MNQLDNNFFEKYIHLDNLCSQMYSCKYGVSEYINDMENSTLGVYRIPSWESDYKNLKHCRWIRSQLAHENIENLCDLEDVDFVENFYERIMSGNDPLTLLRKQKEAQKPINKSVSKPIQNSNKYQQNNTNKVDHKQNNTKSFLYFVVLFIVIILLGLLSITICKGINL